MRRFLVVPAFLTDPALPAVAAIAAIMLALSITLW
jgi:hypothetical protein